MLLGLQNVLPDHLCEILFVGNPKHSLYSRICYNSKIFSSSRMNFSKTNTSPSIVLYSIIPNSLSQKKYSKVGFFKPYSKSHQNEGLSSLYGLNIYPLRFSPLKFISDSG